MALTLTSPAFCDGGAIPDAHAGDGQETSPPLQWSEPLAGVSELALICEDLDAGAPNAGAGEPWVHWIVYKIPFDMRTLVEGLPKKANLGLENGVLQGKNSFGRYGWGGPLPLRGRGLHRYRFRLYGLRSPLEVAEGATRTQMEAALDGIVVESADLVGTYGRPAALARGSKADATTHA